MKKARIPAFIFILLLAFAMTSNEDSVDSTEDLSANTEENTPTQSSNTGYIPSLNIFNNSNTVGKEIGVQSKKTLVSKIASGNGAFKLGISKEKDMPKLGPGAFVYIKSRNSFAVLDNENNRINFYPINPNENSTSIAFPQNRQALGLSVDPAGQVTMLSRQFDAESGASYPYYEVWKLNPSQTKAPWQKKQNFSFSDRATHGAAQSLEMQSMGDTLLFKGLGENEFHTLSPNQNQTQKISGFPTSQGTYIKIHVVEDSAGNSKIQIQESNSKGTLKTHTTNEDITRLTSYRVLPNGYIALDLEADNEKRIPREVVMINPSNGQVRVRSTLRSKENVHIDQDTFYENSRVYQLTEAPRAINEKTNFEILQTDIGEE
jgi:hypothetical protein